jgi:hypothetical protein
MMKTPSLIKPTTLFERMSIEVWHQREKMVVMCSPQKPVHLLIVVN